MTLLDQINNDLKTAMLAGEKARVETLRSLKNAFLYEAVGIGAKNKTLSDQEAQKVLAREAKKRAEAADLYQKANETKRANGELSEKKIIDSYLPQQLDQGDLQALVTKHIKALNASTLADMGKVIGAVKAETGAAADGATIARLVKEALGQ